MVDLVNPDILMHIDNFPKYEYTFEIVQQVFEAGLIEVEYTPVDTRLTKVRLMAPIPPNFDPNNLAAFAEVFAPHPRWFAQEQMLTMKQ